MGIHLQDLEKDLKVHVQGPSELGEIKCEHLNGLAYVVEKPIYNRKLVKVEFVTGKHTGQIMDVPIAICYWTKQDRIKLDYKQFRDKDKN